MTRKQALQLQKDWGRNLTKEDFIQTLYISIKGVGNQTFHQCCCYEQDNYLFIWTKDETFLINKKDLGDFVAITDPHAALTTKKKTKKVT
jgi:hypothetical protein